MLFFSGFLLNKMDFFFKQRFIMALNSRPAQRGKPYFYDIFV